MASGRRSPQVLRPPRAGSRKSSLGLRRRDRRRHHQVIQDTLKDKLGFLGGLLGGLLDFAWAAITYFVLPVLVVDGLGPSPR